ncbi:hypothetical protein QS257_03990 [Terrilactibacillus sp. S3-3]|nr:hypothetical protein QS257_03990 [Terrilactibacillus sp. S3-3]
MFYLNINNFERTLHVIKPQSQMFFVSPEQGGQSDTKQPIDGSSSIGFQKAKVQRGFQFCFARMSTTVTRKAKESDLMMERYVLKKLGKASPKA